MAKYIQATCTLQAEEIHADLGGGNTGVTGSLLVYGEPGKTLHINGLVEGLPHDSYHAFSIRESGNIKNGCTGAGELFNPTPPKANRDDPDPIPTTHGSPKGYREMRKVGSLGNIKSEKDGVAHIEIEDNVAKMNEFYGVVGRSIIISENKDDLGAGIGRSLIDGNAGAPLACCRITAVQDDFLPSGARCEQAGTGPRPQCGIYNECCGKAVISESSSVEVCHDKRAQKYIYQKDAEGHEVALLPFSCLEGVAIKLAATVSATIATAYMLF